MKGKKTEQLAAVCLSLSTFFSEKTQRGWFSSVGCSITQETNRGCRLLFVPSLKAKVSFPTLGVTNTSQFRLKNIFRCSCNLMN